MGSNILNIERSEGVDAILVLEFADSQIRHDQERNFQRKDSEEMISEETISDETISEETKKLWAFGGYFW